MKSNLDDLNREAQIFATEKLDYRLRTRIERSLFLSLQEFAAKFLGYELGGLGSEHRDIFIQHIRKEKLPKSAIGILNTGFNIYKQLQEWRLISDPYEILSDIEKEKHVAFSKKIRKLVQVIRDYVKS